MKITLILMLCTFAIASFLLMLFIIYTSIGDKNEGFMSFVKSFFTNRFKSEKAKRLKKAVDHFLKMYGVDRETCICDIEEYLNSREIGRKTNV